MLLCVTVLCLLFAIVAVASPDPESFTDLPFDLSIPAHRVGGLDGESFRNAMGPQREDWNFAVIQWVAYNGQCLTVAIWVGFVSIILGIKTKIAGRESDFVPSSLRHRVSAWLRSIGRPSLVWSALALLTYMALAPRLVRTAEERFQVNIAFARQPSSHWNKVEKAVQQVQSDEQVMADLRETVEMEMREERETEPGQ